MYVCKWIYCNFYYIKVNSTLVKFHLQKDFGHSQGPDKAEVRMREGRGMRPASPRVQESHRLYRYDKV